MTTSRSRTPRFRRDRSASQPTVTELPRTDTAMTIRQRRCYSCSRHADTSSASKPEEDAVDNTVCDAAVLPAPSGLRGHYAASAPSLVEGLRVEKKRLLSPKLTVITEKTNDQPKEKPHVGKASAVPITRAVLQQLKDPLPVEKDLGIVKWIRATEALRAGPKKNGMTFLPHLWQPAIVENS